MMITDAMCCVQVGVGYDGGEGGWWEQKAGGGLVEPAFSTELQGLISEQWKEMGWQGKDPSTDFRYYIFSSVPAAIGYLFSE